MQYVFWRVESGLQFFFRLYVILSNFCALEGSCPFSTCSRPSINSNAYWIRCVPSPFYIFLDLFISTLLHCHAKAC